MALKNRRFPHLLPPSIAVWERWLEQNPKRFDTIDYDVRVGVGRDPGADFPENIRQDAIDLSMRRIDAVGHSPTAITIIEITEAIGLKALGQIQAYPTLYAQTFQPTLPLKTLIVGNSLESDVLPALTKLQIPFEIV